MINLVALARAARELTSDAVRFGAMLAVMPHAMDDEGVLRLDFKNRQAEKLFFMHPVLLRKCARELEEAGLLRRVGRTGLCAVPDSTSDTPPTLALRELSTCGPSEHRSPLWLPPYDETNGREDTTADAGTKTTCPDLQKIGEAESEGEAEAAEPRSGAGKQSGAADRHSARTGDLNGVVRPELSGKTYASPHACVMGEFSDRFHAATGAKPTIGQREGKIVKRLLSIHGVEEVVRRMSIMFDEKRKWPPPPYTLMTLSTHFDLFSVSSRKITGHVDNDPKKMGPAYYGPITDFSAPWPKNDRKPIR